MQALPLFYFVRKGKGELLLNKTASDGEGELTALRVSKLIPPELDPEKRAIV